MMPSCHWSAGSDWPLYLQTSCTKTGQGEGRPMRMRLRHDQRGAAALEFALVAPLLMFLIYGAVSYGIVLSVKHVMTEAAAEGARAAIGAQIIPGTEADQNAAYVRVASARANGSLGVYKTWAQITPA